MEFYVGTSGWLYDWNPEGNLRWYVEKSGLNAVELNASFYRFPYPSQVRGWARLGRRLRWSVKVHRSITHYKRLGEGSVELWLKFRRLFKPLEDEGLLDFYLFQLPPTYKRTKANIEKLLSFARRTALGSMMAVEFRHPTWFSSETVEDLASVEATIVSIDSPMATWFASSNGLVYARLHGRSAWYAHDYTLEELSEIAREIQRLSPRRVYVFFNNDHWMLGNARALLRILGGLG